MLTIKSCDSDVKNLSYSELQESLANEVLCNTSQCILNKTITCLEENTVHSSRCLKEYTMKYA